MSNELRPPVNLAVIQRQIAAITDYLRKNVWQKDSGGKK